MKRLFRWTVAAVLAALLSASLAGVGTAQEPQELKAKAAKAAKAIEAKKAADSKKVAAAKKAEQVKKAEQAKKQRSAQEAKLNALRKTVDDLMAKRKALAQSDKENAPQVEKITAQIEKVTKRAQEMRHAAKPAEPKIVKNPVAVARAEAQAQVALAQRAAEKARKAMVRDSAKRRSDAEKHEQGLGQTMQREKVQAHDEPPYVKRMKQLGLQGERVGVDFPNDEIRQRLRVANERERDVQARQNARRQESTDRPGPMEVTRRLQVLEDRLSSIERKLDQLLQQVSRRGVGPDGSQINRRPGIGGGGPPSGMPPQMRSDRPSRRGAGPGGPPGTPGAGPGFGDPVVGPPPMRNENDGADRARRPRDAEPRPGRPRTPEDRPRGEIDQVPPPRFPGEPDGPPPGAYELPPAPDSPDAPRRRERTPPPDDQQGPRGR